MATKQPTDLRVKVVRPFRMSGLDPATKNYKDGVLGVGAVVTLPVSFANQMLTGGKVELTNEEIHEAPQPEPIAKSDKKKEK